MHYFITKLAFAGDAARILVPDPEDRLSVERGEGLTRIKAKSPARALAQATVQRALIGARDAQA